MKIKTDPVLLGSVPSDNSTAVDPDSVVRLTFSESMAAGAGNIFIRNSDGSDFLQIHVKDKSQVDIKGHDVVITPIQPLNANASYYIYFESGVLVDKEGNAFAGITDPDTLNFDTVDTIAPELTSSTPADDTNAVPVGSDIVLNFNEAVVAGTGDIVISDGSDIRTIDIQDATQVTITDNIVTVNPTDDLNFGTNYNVQLASGVINDDEGNTYEGINDDTTLNFSTEQDSDPSIVVFDLVSGVSSSHSDRTFDANTQYTIYIRVDSDSAAVKTDASSGPGTYGVWQGADSLGSDDHIVLVGNDQAVDVIGLGGAPANELLVAGNIVWRTSLDLDAAAIVRPTGLFERLANDNFSAARIFTQDQPMDPGDLPNADATFTSVYQRTMADSILVTQGLL